MDVWFRRAQNCLQGFVFRVGWSANTLSYQAVFFTSRPLSLLLRGDPIRFSLVRPCRSHMLKCLPFCLLPLPSVSPTSGYTAVLRMTRNFLILIKALFTFISSCVCVCVCVDRYEKIIYPDVYICICISKVDDRSRERTEGSLFDSYYIEV